MGAVHFIIAVGLLCAVFPAAVRAGEGRIEINQASALAGGVTPLDAPGFPVTLSSPGSYVLTSDLVAPASLPAIELRQQGIAVDLNGFSLRGAGMFGTPASGVVSHLQFGFNSTIRNGRIERFLGQGIDLASVPGIEVRDVYVTGNGQGGISLGEGGFVHRVRVISNASFGLKLGATTAFEEVVAKANTGGDVIGGVQIGPSHCGDRSCWSKLPPRRFYLSVQSFTGAQAADPGRCTAGFHFASLYEILDPAALRYDNALGVSNPDSGEGAPSGLVGWVRTGSFSSTDSPGSASGWVNCAAWSVATPTTKGSFAHLTGAWVPSTPPDQANPIAPWRGGTRTCDVPQRIWCVED